jgi:phage minor structural protein
VEVFVITLYDKFSSDFSTLGKGALNPTECRIEEEAGGMYELTLVHPMSLGGRHKRMALLDIIKAPAPNRVTPLIEMGQTAEREVYRVVTDGRRLYLRSAPSTDAKGLHAYEPGTEVMSLGVSGDWRQVAVLAGGASGWMWADNLEFVRTESVGGGKEVVEPRQTREQLFRIDSVEPDSKLRTVTVRAKHITYDLAGAVVVGEYSPQAVPAAQVCTELMARADHDVSAFHVYCATDAPITASYGGRNIINCLLDDKDGVAVQAGAMVVRDNFDIFILPQEEKRSGVQLRYGKNLLSASMITDAADLVTRIRPVGRDADGNRLYLPENDGFVDSVRIGDYPTVYARETEYDVVEGGAVTHAQALTMLRSKARADLAVYDRPQVTLDADFLRLEQIEAYRHLVTSYALHLYDRVPVIDREAGILADVAMVRYVYDGVLDCYRDTKLGDVRIGAERNEIVTAEYDAIHTDSYAGGSWSYYDDNDVRQGWYDGTRIRGCMWFDCEVMRGELTGKRIIEAWIRLYAQTGVGRGTAVDVELYGTDMAYDGRSGAPALTAGYGVIGKAEPGKEVLLSVPMQAVEDMLSGTVCALMLYSADAEGYDGRTYSRNYARFDGETSGSADTMPCLTITAQTHSGGTAVLGKAVLGEMVLGQEE